jgi:hypothetical protein
VENGDTRSKVAESTDMQVATMSEHPSGKQDVPSHAHKGMMVAGLVPDIPRRFEASSIIPLLSVGILKKLIQ